METLIVYMAKVSGLLALFFLAYHLLLRKETFFTGNRWFLLAGLATSLLLPLIVYTKVIWIDPSPRPETQTINLSQLIAMQNMKQATAPEAIDINWLDVLGGMYLAGAALFLIRFVLDIRSIKRVLRGNKMIKDGRFCLVDSDKVQSPFSFFNYIVYNPALLQPEELESIIAHEKVHSAQRHSLDMIAAQLFCAAFWFNPIVWLYKKSISQNLEFIADAEAIKLLADSKAYQKTLLKITLQPECIAITNHFYQSLIKKRIVMLNKQKSKRLNSWKYACVLPLLTAFIMLFQVKVVAQEKETAYSSTTQEKTKIAIEINKDSKDEELEKESKTLKEKFDADVTFSNVTRNAASEITAIKVAVKDKTQSKVYEVSGNEPIASFTIEIEKSSDSAKNSIVFGAPGNFRMSADRVVYTKDTIYTKRPVASGIIFSDDIAPPMTPSPPPTPYHGNIAFEAGDELIVINGVKQPKGQKIALPPGEMIGAINVIKGKDAKRKYGRDAKKGAVEITTRRGEMGYRMHINGPAQYTYVSPQDGQVFEFEMPEFEFGEMPEFDGDVDVMISSMPIQVFTDMNDDMVKAIVDMRLSDEQMKITQLQLNDAHIQLEKMKPQMEARLRDRLSREELKGAMKEMRRELDQARKEIDEARKELDKSRKELKKKSN